MRRILFWCFGSVFWTVSTPAAPLLITPLDLGAAEIEIGLQLEDSLQWFILDTGASQSCMSTLAFLSPCSLEQKPLNRLGMDLMQGRILDFDFAHNQVTERAKIARHWKVQPLARRADGQSQVEIHLAGLKSIWGVVDTGSALSSVDLGFVKSHPAAFVFVATEPKSKMKIYRVNELTVGDLTLHQIFVAAMDFGRLRETLGPETPLVLGNNILVQGHWLFDFSSNLWSVEPEEERKLTTK